MVIGSELGHVHEVSIYLFDIAISVLHAAA